MNYYESKKSASYLLMQGFVFSNIDQGKLHFVEGKLLQFVVLVPAPRGLSCCSCHSYPLVQWCNPSDSAPRAVSRSGFDTL